VAEKTQRLGSLYEAAAAWHVHPDTIRRRVASGELTGYKLGRKILRVDLDEVDSLFRPIPTAGGASAAGGT
jgi:excisionase family DNA binding protein